MPGSDRDEKRFLGAVFALSLKGVAATPGQVSALTGLGAREASALRSALTEGGFVRSEKGRVRLTAQGRGRIRVVFLGGGFEIVHPGHLYTIEKAKELGDVLVVVAARDKTIRKSKGREPVTGEQERVRLLSSLRPVDAAILGGTGDIYSTLEKVRPDVVALGYDQRHNEKEIAYEAERRGMKLSVVRLGSPMPGVKTSRIIGAA